MPSARSSYPGQVHGPIEAEQVIIAATGKTLEETLLEAAEGGGLGGSQMTGVTILPTMGAQTSGAYSVGDFVDGKLTLPNAAKTAGGSGYIESVRITSKSPQSGVFDVVFFNADLTTVVVDNGVRTITAADLLKVIGVVHCNDINPLIAGSVHQAVNQGLAFKLPAGTSIYAFIVCQFALTTTSTSDIALAVDIRQD
jgi:hypothetical protein